MSLNAKTLKGRINISGKSSSPSVPVTWSNVQNKPFSTVDTENGLTIQDDTLMIDTLDHIATIDYVDQQIAGITPPVTDWEDLTNKPFETISHSDFGVEDGELQINKSSVLDGYATEQYVDGATTTVYDSITTTLADYATKSEIPTVPTDVSAFNNDAGYITSSALSGYATEQYVNTATTSAYNAATTYASGLTNGLATESYVNAATTAVANDIPTADGTTIIDNNGVWSAVGGGSSTQSDWEQNDSSASDYVKNRTHYVTRTSVSESWDNNGDPIYNGIYPDGERDNYHKVEWRINDSNTRQDILDFLDAVPVDADFSVSVSYNYTYEWEGSTESNSDRRTFTFHKESEGEHGFGGDEDDTSIEIDEDFDGYYKIRIELWNIQEEHDNDPTLDTTLNSVSFVCNTTTVSYTKLDSNYINIDNNTIKVNGEGQLYADNSMNAKMGINISNKDISVKSDLNAFGPVDMGDMMNENKLNTLNTPLGTYIGGGIIKTASTDDVENIKFTTWPSLSFDSSSTRREKWRCTNFITDRNLRRVHAITKYYKWYDNRWFGPYYISGMFIGERINDSYEIKIEGWESILDSIVHNGGGYDFTFKEDITISPTESRVPFPFIFIQGRDNIPDPQKINSYFLPIDNDTIKVDSDGNIYADVQGGGGGGSTDWDDITNKPTFATVATSGDYDDLSNKPTIPSTTGLATEQYVDDAIDALNIPDAVSVSQTLQSGTAIADITIGDTTTTLYAPAGGGGGGSSTQANWAETDSTADSYIQNKPNIYASTGTNSIAAQGGIASGTNSIKIGTGVQSWRVASGDGAIVIGDGRATQQYAIHIGNGTESSAGALATRAIAIGNAGAQTARSIAIGDYVKASGPQEVAIGREINQVFNSNQGNYLFGEGLQQYAYNGSALTKCGYRGYFNKASNGVKASISYLDILGNGTGAQAANRNNAEATDWSGNKYLAGDIYVNVTDWTNPQANSIKLANIPAPPTTDGTYTLQVVVSNGEPTYSWV